jgi:hypothetical protein
MSNWGATDADESKPKYLTDAQKKEVYATTPSWEVGPGSKMTGNGRTGADPEVLVAMSGLPTNLGAGTITSVGWVTEAWDASAGGTIQAVVRWNEAVDVVEAGSGLKITIDRTPDGGSAASHTLRYASGTGGNELIFSLAIAGGAPVAALDVFAMQAQTLVKAGATSCKDAGTNTNSELVITAAQVTAAGSFAATA